MSCLYYPEKLFAYFVIFNRSIKLLNDAYFIAKVKSAQYNSTKLIHFLKDFLVYTSNGSLIWDNHSLNVNWLEINNHAKWRIDSEWVFLFKSGKLNLSKPVLQL